MRPVEQIEDVAGARRRAARRPSRRSGAWSGSRTSPVKQFAPPELSTIASTTPSWIDLLRPDDRVRLRAVAGEDRGADLERAAVDHDGDVGLAGRLEADGDAGRLESLGRGDAHGATPFTVARCLRARPSAMFMDWIAAPAVPLTRLSTAVTTTTRFAARSIARPISAVFAPRTSAVRGNSPGGQQLHEGLVAVGGLPGAADVGIRRAVRRSARSRSRGCRGPSARAPG